MAVVNAAIYGGGILADPRGGNSTYGYKPLRPATRSAIDAMLALAESYGTDLPTVALQASLRDPHIDATVVGISKPSRIGRIMQSVATQLPDEFWDSLEALVPGPDEWLDSAR